MSDNEESKVISLAGARGSKEKDQEKETRESKEDSKKEPVICSFCERPNYMVVKMIEGPGVNICSECTLICVQYFMLADRIPTDEARKILDAFWNISKRNT